MIKCGFVEKQASMMSPLKNSAGLEGGFDRDGHGLGLTVTKTFPSKSMPNQSRGGQ